MLMCGGRVKKAEEKLEDYRKEGRKQLLVGLKGTRQDGRRCIPGTQERINLGQDVYFSTETGQKGRRQIDVFRKMGWKLEEGLTYYGLLFFSLKLPSSSWKYAPWRTGTSIYKKLQLFVSNLFPQGDPSKADWGLMIKTESVQNLAEGTESFLNMLRCSINTIHVSFLQFLKTKISEKKTMSRE